MSPRVKVFIVRVIAVIFLIIGALVFLSMIGCSPLAQIATATATAEPTATEPAILSTSVALSPIPEVCTVATGYETGALNLRTKPGTQYAVIRVLAEGESLQVIARGAWLQVIDANGARGYVNSKFCKVEP